MLRLLPSLLSRRSAPLFPRVLRSFHATPLAAERLLVVDGIEPMCAQILRDAGHTVDERPKLTAPQLLAIIGDYEGLVVRSETKVTVRHDLVWE